MLCSNIFPFFKTILLSNEVVEISSGYRFLDAFMGKGLLTNGEEDCHVRSSLLTPAFHFQLHSKFKHHMVELCDIMIEKLRKVVDGQPVKVYNNYITLFASAVICGNKKTI